jgi:hypothetical protein
MSAHVWMPDDAIEADFDRYYRDYPAETDPDEVHDTEAEQWPQEERK